MPGLVQNHGFGDEPNDDSRPAYEQTDDDGVRAPIVLGTYKQPDPNHLALHKAQRQHVRQCNHLVGDD